MMLKVKKKPIAKSGPSFKVLFVPGQAHILDEHKTIYLLMSNRKEGDFGIHSNFKFFLTLNQNKIELELKIGFLDQQQDPREILKQKFSDHHSPVSPKELPPFFSLLEDLESYRKIVRTLGPNLAQKSLISINDMVATGKTAVKPVWYNEALKSRVFNISLLRSSESFAAFHKAARVLDGLEFEELYSYPASFKLNFFLSKYNNPIDLKVNFTPGQILDKNICAFIGINGSGKSSAIKHIVESLLKNDKKLTTLDGERPQINRVLAFGHSGELATSFPPRGRSRNIDYRLLELKRSKSSDQWDGLCGTIIKLIKSDQSIQSKSRLSIFINAISEVMDVNKIAFHMNKNSKYYEEGTPHYYLSELIQPFPPHGLVDIISDIIIGSDPEYMCDGKAYPLSSGQLYFMRFAALMALNIENGSLVLIDEPESFLHPNLITKLHTLLKLLLRQTGSSAVVATHSAYFVRELPRSQVLIFRPEGNNLVVSIPTINTLGADIGEISGYVFEDEFFGAFVDNLVLELKNSKDKEQKRILAELESELPPEALIFIENELDPKGFQFE